MPVGDTLVNLVVNGAIALGLARLLQQQYEARIKAVTDGYEARIKAVTDVYEARILDLKERVAAQSVKIDVLLKSNDQLADAALVSANAVRAVAPEKG